MSEANPYESPNAQAAVASSSRTDSRAPFARAFLRAGAVILFITLLGGGLGAIGGYVLHRTLPELVEGKRARP